MLRALVHRRRRMVANAERLQKRMWRLAVVVAVQNVLVTVCLTVTLYVFWDVQSRTAGAEQTSRDNVHIRLNTVSDVKGNVTVKFTQAYSSNMMSLSELRKDQIHVNCTGPYVLHMFACYTCYMGEVGARGSLRLLAVGRETPVSVFDLQASHEVCKGFQSVAYLKDKERISLQLVSMVGFKIKNVTVGLSYLLDTCEWF